jgi:hypothetical protein
MPNASFHALSDLHTDYRTDFTTGSRKLGVRLSIRVVRNLHGGDVLRQTPVGDN